MSKVINGGFETGDFQGWETGSLPQLEPPIIVTIAHSGTHSAMLKPGAFIRQAYTRPVTQVSSLQYWISTTGTGSVNVSIYFDRFFFWFKRGSVSGPGIMEAEDGAWRNYVLKVPKRKSIRAIKFECAGSTMGVYLDDISFMPIRGLVTPV